MTGAAHGSGAHLRLVEPAAEPAPAALARESAFDRWWLATVATNGLESRWAPLNTHQDCMRLALALTRAAWCAGRGEGFLTGNRRPTEEAALRKEMQALRLENLSLREEQRRAAERPVTLPLPNDGLAVECERLRGLLAEMQEAPKRPAAKPRPASGSGAVETHPLPAGFAALAKTVARVVNGECSCHDLPERRRFILAAHRQLGFHACVFCHRRLPAHDARP